MKIDRRVTNGLAWAGVFIVVGVPVADILSAQFLGDPVERMPQAAVVAAVTPAAAVAPVPAPLSQRPAAAPKPATQVAAVAPAPAKPVTPAKAPTKPVAAAPAKPAAATPAKPAATPAAQTADVVDAYLQSGRKLPGYITDDSASPTPARVAATPPARTPIITEPAAPAAPTQAVDPVQVAAIPAKEAPVPMPLSMRPEPITVPIAVAAPAPALVVVPPTGNVPVPPASITARDLEDWESGPLAEFLAERQQQGEANGYHEGGFFLDEAPPVQRPRRDRFVGPINDGFLWFAD